MKKYLGGFLGLLLFFWLTSFTFADRCSDLYWANSISRWDDQCVCKAGYIFNKSKTKCVEETKELGDYWCMYDYWAGAESEEDDYRNCVCKEWYEWDWTECAISKEYLDKMCKENFWKYSEVDEDDYSLCECIDWYTWNKDKTSCEKYTQETADRDCKDAFGTYSVANSDDYSSCICREWYEWNSAGTKCILIGSEQVNKWNTRDQELKEAIEWMYSNWLTIFNTPSTFMSNDNLTREQASKFFAQFAAKVLNKSFTDNVDLNKFPDIKNADPTLTYYIIQANYMWLFQWSNWNFMPFNKLTQAQAIAVVVRMIDWYLDESAGARYTNYYNKADSYWLLKRWNFDLSSLDKTNITRWDMALILYTLYKAIYSADDKISPVIDYNDSMVNSVNACVNVQGDVSDIIENWTTAQIQSAFKKVVNVCKESEKEVKNLWDWDGDDSLQKAVLNLLSYSISYYNKALELTSYRDLEGVTYSQEKEYESLQSELDELDEKFKKSSKDLEDVQSKFAEKYGFELLYWYVKY